MDCWNLSGATGCGALCAETKSIRQVEMSRPREKKASEGLQMPASNPRDGFLDRSIHTGVRTFLIHSDRCAARGNFFKQVRDLRQLNFRARGEWRGEA